MADVEPVVVSERRGAVLVLRLNRPEARNAIDGALMVQLGEGLRDAERDPEVGAVVLTGTGDKAFCAGVDLRALSEMTGEPDSDEEGGRAYFHRFNDGSTTIPVVGAAQATAVAGGLELLLNCDLVVAAESAQFGLPEVKRGLIAGGGGSLISSRVPLAVALEITLTGENFDARRAYEVGLVNRVVPADDVVDEAVELASRIAQNGPLALRATREVVRLANVDMAAARARQAELIPEIFGSDDAREGAAAFMERRSPVWRGR